MGVQPSQLHTCNKAVKAVGGSTLICKGWLPVRFEIEEHFTKQPVYICEKVDRLYFSKQGCVQVNILSRDYPRPMHPPKAHVHSLNIDNLLPAPPTTPRLAPPARPAKLPYPPTTENIPKLEQYIRDKFSATVFNNSPPFPVLSGPAAKIHQKENAILVNRHTPVPLPHHWKAEVKASLDRDFIRVIIAPVPIGTPVTSCSPMVVVSKPDGTPRRTIDFQKLNAQCLRETHHTNPTFQFATKIPPHTKKTVIDAVDGYHSVALDLESQLLTTFITEWGRYMQLRIPQGFVAAGDAYTRRYDAITEGVPQKVKIVDDALLHDVSIEDHFFHVRDYLTLCANDGAVVNAPKQCKMESPKTLSYDPKLSQKTHSRNIFFNHLFRLRKVLREMNVERCEFQNIC